MKKTYAIAVLTILLATFLPAYASRFEYYIENNSDTSFTIGFHKIKEFSVEVKAGEREESTVGCDVTRIQSYKVSMNGRKVLVRPFDLKPIQDEGYFDEFSYVTNSVYDKKTATVKFVFILNNLDKKLDRELL